MIYILLKWSICFSFFLASLYGSALGKTTPDPFHKDIKNEDIKVGDFAFN